MISNKENTSVNGIGVLILVFFNAVIAKMALIRNENWYWILVVTIPILLIAIWNLRKKKHIASGNYGIPSHLRYLFEHKAK